MRRSKRAWATIGVAATPVGSALGRLHLIGPDPGTFLGLGALAALSVVGMIHGLRQGRRVARSDGLVGE